MNKGSNDTFDHPDERVLVKVHNSSMERRNRVLKSFSGHDLLCPGHALLCPGHSLLYTGHALLCPKKRIYRHFKRILGDPEVTAYLYCNFVYPYWEACRFAVYICGNFWVTQYVLILFQDWSFLKKKVRIVTGQDLIKHLKLLK